MATFPALKPAIRTFTPGTYPNTALKAVDGTEGRVRHSNIFLNSTLNLTFNAITESQLVSIITHFQGQKGIYESFALPSDVWSGLTTPSDFSPTGYRWRYARAPVIEDLQAGNHNVSVELVTVPAEGVVTTGLTGRINLSLTPGQVAVSNGITKTITISLAPGSASV